MTAPAQYSRRAAITVAITVVCVLGFALTVLGLTGVLTGRGAVRRSPDSGPMEITRRWFRLDISLMAQGLPELPSAPVLVAIDNDGIASVVNGREELQAKAALDETTFTLELPDSGAHAELTADGARYTGTLQMPLGPDTVARFPVTATPLPEGLPELRFLKAPDRPEARIADADLSHVWAVQLGGGAEGDPVEPGRMVVFVTDTGELQLSLTTANTDYGTLAGRQFGRLGLASTLADYTLTVLALELAADGESLTGTVSALGHPPRSLRGVRSDRVTLSPRAPCGPPPAGPGPAVVLVLDPWTRASLDALRFAARATRRLEGLAVRATTTRGDAPRLAALATAYGIPVTPAAPDRPVGQTCVWLLDAAGRVVDQSSQFPSAFAGGRDLEARLETAIRQLAAPAP